MKTPQIPIYFLRWKGREFGPFDQQTLREMLRRGEISLAHQVLWEDRWILVSEFIAYCESASEARSASTDSYSDVNFQSFSQALDPTSHSLDAPRRNATPPPSFARPNPPPFPWLRLTAYALISFVAYTLFQGDIGFQSHDSSIQQSTLDIWTEKNSIDRRYTSIGDQFEHSKKISAAYSKLRLESADPILSSYLRSSVDLYKEGSRLVTAFLMDAQRTGINMSESEMHKRFLAAVKKYSLNSSSMPDDVAGSATEGDVPEPLQKIFIKHLTAVSQWQNALQTHLKSQTELANELSKKYATTFRIDP